jgi:SAM-dependent methyltransferase
VNRILKGLLRDSFLSIGPHLPSDVFSSSFEFAHRNGILHTYQPPYSRPGDRLSDLRSTTLRPCRDRLLALQDDLKEVGRGSCLDIGCNIGFFTLALADGGYDSVGIDPAFKNIQLAQGLKKSLGLNNVIFRQEALTPESVDDLEEFDIILCLSVFHYWVSMFGLEGASKIMSVLAAKCRSRLFFEPGLPSEATYAGVMSFMEPDYGKWIETYLTDFGLTEVRLLGTFISPEKASRVERLLYAGSGPKRA